MSCFAFSLCLQCRHCWSWSTTESSCMWCTHGREESKRASTDPVFTFVLHKAGF